MTEDQYDRNRQSDRRELFNDYEVFLCISVLALAVAMVYQSRPKVEADSPYKKATFAGGCFWCMEAPFEKLDGVIEVVSGYTAGQKEDPSYEEVCSGSTGHAEAIQILYDPSKVTYAELLDVFWMQIDPTDPGGQFADRGSQYRTGIYYHDEEQKDLAEALEEGLAGFRQIPAAHRHRDRGGDEVLRGRGIPPGLLQNEPCALQALSKRVRT